MHDGILRRVLFAMAVLLFGSAGAAFATTLTIQPSNQDAYVTRSRPNAVFGSAVTATRLFVQPDNPLTRYERALVEFDLPIPQFSTITSATLQINQQSGVIPAARIHGAHRVTSSWLQSSVKWNTMPAFNPVPTATASVGLSRGFKNFDVTPDVQAMVNSPATNHGWMVIDTRETLDNSNNREVGYVAREEFHGPDIPKRPILLVDYSAPSCTQNSQCADTNACTVNERCEAGHCAVDQLGCDDGDLCTDDICDVQQGCVHLSGICSDGFSCTQDICDPGTGACSYVFDNTVCLHGGCQTGSCVADQNSSTLDPVTGCQVASVAPDGSPCSDANGCTQTDTCAGGDCQAGSPVVCSGDQCRNAGTCNPGTGLCNGSPKPSGTACADGNACTQTDACDGAGTCAGANPVVCTPLDQCHLTGTCNTTSGVCSNPNAPNGTTCSDGDLCTTGDACQGGGCDPGSPVVCSPLGQCYDAGACNPGSGVCSNPPKPGGAGCIDGNACTQTDACDGAGACSGTNPVVCTPSDQCHVAGACDTGTGACSNPNATNGTACTDGDACTQSDGCQGGACAGGSPVVCTPLDQCHLSGTCDSGTGVCSNPNAPNGTPCSDGNTCTIGDQCSAGDCGGDPTTCGDNTVQPSCGEQCDGGSDCSATCQFLCGPTPRTDCVTASAPQKARLIVKNRTPDKRDLLVWKFTRGNAVTATQLGDPVNGTTSFRLCLWDASANPQPLFSADLAASGTCGVRPCWKAVGSGAKFKDRDGFQHGTTGVLLKYGATAKSKAQWKGKNVLLLPPTLPLAPAVTVQLENSEGTCWTTTFPTALANTTEQFKAKGD